MVNLGTVRPGLLGVFVLAPLGCLDPRALPPLTFGVTEADVWRDGAPPFAPAAPGERRLIVTNSLDDSVSVLSWDLLIAGGTGAQLARFPVGLVPLEREGPHHVSVDRDGAFAYIGISNFVPGGGSGPHGVHGAGTADGRTLKIDLDTLRTVAATRVDRNPGDVRLSPDGATLVLSHFDLVRVAETAAAGIERGPETFSRLALVDATTLVRSRMVPMCAAPHGVAFTSDGQTLVSSCLSDEAAVVDIAGALRGDDDASLVTVVPLLDAPGPAQRPACGPYAITVSATNQTAWVSCYSSGELVAVDVAARTRGATLALPGLAVFGDVSEGGDLLAIATQDTDGVMLFDIGAGDVLTVRRFLAFTPDVCGLPHTALFLDSDTRLAVVCEGDKRSPGRVIAVDVTSGEVIGGVDVGIFPDDVALQVRP
jgi:DNA-binding beta-propeller fold protein YncE